MKRTQIALTLALCMSIGLAGCGRQAQPENPGGGSDPSRPGGGGDEVAADCSPSASAETANLATAYDAALRDGEGEGQVLKHSMLLSQELRKLKMSEALKCCANQELKGTRLCRMLVM